MYRKSNYCSRYSGKPKLTRCTWKSQLGDPAKFYGRSSPGRFTSSCVTRNDDGEHDDHGQDFHAKPCQNDNVAKDSGKSESQTRVCSLNSEQKGQGSFTEPYADDKIRYKPQRSSEPLVERSKQALLSLASFSEANRAKQPSSLKSACKPANERSPLPTFSQLVDKKSGQPKLSKSTYKPRSGGSHLPGSSNPAVKERLEKPARSPCPVNEDRSVSGKRGVTEEIPPHGIGVKEGVNSKHNVGAFDELEMEDIARVALEMFEGLNLLHNRLESLVLENRQEHRGEEFHNSPADKTSPSPSNAVCGKCHICEEISPGGHSDDESVSESLEEITIEQFEKAKSLSFRAMKLQSAYDNIASTARRLGINVDGIARSSST